ncbi:sensor histidine kinase [Rhodococcoides trifolii]|nr:histidine kinase [Rhodococcus trifolii]
MTTTAAKVRRRAATTAIVAFCLFCTFMTAGLAGFSGSPPWSVAVGSVLNFAAGVALIWRRQKPWLVLAVSVAGPLLFPTDGTAALFALFAVTAVARGWRLVGATVVVFFACSASLSYDAYRRRDYSVLTIGIRVDKTGPAPEWNLPLWVPCMVALGLVLIVLGIAYFRRTKTDLDNAVRSRDHVTAQSAKLREEMLLTEERARIARDMHDTLAAGLSRISLLAGGMQVNSGDGPAKVSNTASLIRSTAHDSLDELKRIIGVLRGSDTGGIDSGRRSIAGIGDLVDSARTTGMRVRYVQDVAPGDVGPLTSHVAYRVVQESLTNAHKHSPSSPVQVSVGGSDASGLTIEVRNHLAGTVSSTPGAGHGLGGLTEQVGSAGGHLTSGAAQGGFVVTAWLPWYS